MRRLLLVLVVAGCSKPAEPLNSKLGDLLAERATIKHAIDQATPNYMHEFNTERTGDRSAIQALEAERVPLIRNLAEINKLIEAEKDKIGF